MLAFAAKLAGPLLILLTLSTTGFIVADRAPERSFSENLAGYARTFTAREPPPLPAFREPSAIAIRPRPPPVKDDFAATNAVIDDLLQGQPSAQVGIAVRWSNGERLYLRNAETPFPLASVAKTYMLVAYLARLQQEQRGPDPDENELLKSMIGVSDNDSAQEIWDALGGLDAMQAYLASIGAKPLTAPPPDEDEDPYEQRESWGDASQTASEMSVFLARLWQKELLNPDMTQLARDILGSVVEEQAWGVTTGVDVLDPGASVLVKNGWYPTDDDRWRINSAGIVVPSQGEPYVLVIFGEGFDSWADGIEIVNGVAAAINQLLLS